MRLLPACVLFAPAGVVLAQTVAPVERAEVERFAGIQTVPSANTSPGAGRSTPITANYTDESLAKALASMGDMAGIKMLFDSNFRDRTLTIRFDGETFDVALAQVLRTNRLFTKVLGERTLVVTTRATDGRQGWPWLSWAVLGSRTCQIWPARRPCRRLTQARPCAPA